MQIKALVVDNNPVLLKAISAILEQEGCTVQSAGTGLAALEIIDDFQPDILFTDLIMPMVSGEQLCRLLRNTPKYHSIYIVVVSAILLEDKLRILREIPCDMCIAKGNLQEIRLHLQSALQAYALRPTRRRGAGPDIIAAQIPDSLKPSVTTGELLVEKRHMHAILASLDEGIIELNFQGKVITANASALKILDCREERIIGVMLSHALDWGGFKDGVRDWTERQLIGQGMKKFDILEDKPLFLNNRILTVTLSPIEVDGAVFGLCIVRDITRQYTVEQQQKELDNALKLVKKMDAMSCMAGGLGHDFNNLLTVICGNLDMLSLYGESQTGRKRDKLLQEAKLASLVAVDLTRQISCFSNFGIVNRENIQVESLVTKTVDGFFSGDQGQYRLEVSAVKDLIYGDPQELAQAIVKVLQNAVDASGGKPLAIHIGENDFDAPQLMAGQYVPAGNYIRIDIRDAGQGISPEQLFRIFDPYYSTKERGVQKGMGLGLTVVYSILRNHGGYVVVDSELQQGTVVSFYIPSLAEKQRGAAVSRGDRCVLLMEPDEQMLEIEKIMLGYLGFVVVAVADETEAIDELQRLRSNPQVPLPLVILALNDDNRTQAVETCRMLHSLEDDLKIIAMSGLILDPVMQNCHDHGFANTLPKPITMDSLKHVTSTVLAS